MKNWVLLLFISFMSHSLLAQNRTDSVHLSLTITSDDLSEDMNQLSSGNDELILLVYNSDFGGIEKPVFVQEFVFERKINTKTFEISYVDLGWQTRAYPEPTIAIYLIERDSKNSTERIEAPITVYQKEILQLHKLKKTAELENYLGDEDLLLACKLSLFHRNGCKNNYINNLDRYSYQVELELKE